MDDETRAANTAMAGDVAEGDTALVMNYPPTDSEQLAWSHEDAIGDLPTAAGVHHRSHSLTHWGIAIAAVLVAGFTALWFGSVLYHDEKPVAKPPTVHVPMPPPAPKVTPTPTAAPPVEPPHAAPKFSWLSIVVSIPAKVGERPVVTSGFGSAADVALQGTLQECRSAGGQHCIEAMAISNGCGAVALGNGAYGVGDGPTRAIALVNAKANLPTASASYAFCLWDGNDTPAIATSAPAAPATVKGKAATLPRRGRKKPA